MSDEYESIGDRMYRSMREDREWHEQQRREWERENRRGSSSDRDNNPWTVSTRVKVVDSPPKDLKELNQKLNHLYLSSEPIPQLYSISGATRMAASYSSYSKYVAIGMTVAVPVLSCLIDHKPSGYDVLAVSSFSLAWVNFGASYAVSTGLNERYAAFTGVWDAFWKLHKEFPYLIMETDSKGVTIRYVSGEKITYADHVHERNSSKNYTTESRKPIYATAGRIGFDGRIVSELNSMPEKEEKAKEWESKVAKYAAMSANSIYASELSHGTEARKIAVMRELGGSVDNLTKMIYLNRMFRKDESEQVRMAALNALKGVDDKRLVGLMEASFDNEVSWEIRRRMVDILSGMDLTIKQFSSLLPKALKDPEPKVRIKAAKALGTIAGRARDDNLREVMREDTKLAVRFMAYMSLKNTETGKRMISEDNKGRTLIPVWVLPKKR